MDTPEETRGAENVAARLRHMDELGIDIQVLYPTMFIEQIAEKSEIEVALCKAYNRWAADIWSQSNNRLRWACVLPVSAMDESLAQIDFARKNGACAVYMRSIETDRLIHDPYFHPIYARAVDLDMADRRAHRERHSGDARPAGAAQRRRRVLEVPARRPWAPSTR